MNKSVWSTDEMTVTMESKSTWRKTSESVWYAGWTCIPDSHPHRVTNTKCRINTAVSPDDGHTVA